MGFIGFHLLQNIEFSFTLIVQSANSGSSPCALSNRTIRFSSLKVVDDHSSRSNNKQSGWTWTRLPLYPRKLDMTLLKQVLLYTRAFKGVVNGHPESRLFGANK